MTMFIQTRTPILFLDDNPDRHVQLESRYPGFVKHVYTVDQFTDALSSDEFDSFEMVSLDHDLNDFDCQSLYNDQEATGLDACGLMLSRVEWRAKIPETIHIHSVNPCGASNMRALLERHGFTVRWNPFSA